MNSSIHNVWVRKKTPVEEGRHGRFGVMNTDDRRLYGVPRPAPPPRRPRPLPAGAAAPPAGVIVSSGAAIDRPPRPVGTQPSLDGPFCTKTVSGAKIVAFRYCWPAEP